MQKPTIMAGDWPRMTDKEFTAYLDVTVSGLRDFVDSVHKREKERAERLFRQFLKSYLDPQKFLKLAEDKELVLILRKGSRKDLITIADKKSLINS